MIGLSKTPNGLQYGILNDKRCVLYENVNYCVSLVVLQAFVSWFGWMYWGLTSLYTAEVISWRSVTHMCFLAFSQQY